MMSLSAIRQMTRDAGVRAAEENQTPYVFWEQDVEALRGGGKPSSRIPFTGSHRPEGWTLVRVLFVDSSGWGQPGEPALTLQEFGEQARAGRAYSVIEAGQFQVHIGEWVKEGQDPGDLDFSHHGVFTPEGMTARYPELL